jgi:predicted ATPase
MNLSKLKLENFKCFKETELDFGKITLLTGANSSGKSSLIYALLAMFQTENFPFYLSPNGQYISLGNFKNMVSEYDISNEIRIDFELKFNNGNNLKFLTKWQNNTVNGLPFLKQLIFEDDVNGTFEAETENNEFLIKAYNSVERYNTINQNTLKEIFKLNGFKFYPIFNDINFAKDLPFNFIHSYRTNPQRNYLQIPKAGKIQPNGAGFENQIIEWEETNSPKLKELVNILSKIGVLFSLNTTKIGDGMFDIKIQTKQNGILSSIADVGFGVSKLLPVIVADLQLPDNSLLAISEPEIDLHPSIQANFANYLYEQTKKGKKYIIETHSEYLINRLRLLIAKGDLKEDEVKTYFFSNDGRKSITYPINLKIDGQIENAPIDFFETYEIDVMEIAMQG